MNKILLFLIGTLYSQAFICSQPTKSPYQSPQASPTSSRKSTLAKPSSRKFSLLTKKNNKSTPPTKSTLYLTLSYPNLYLLNITNYKRDELLNNFPEEFKKALNNLTTQKTLFKDFNNKVKQEVCTFFTVSTLAQFLRCWRNQDYTENFALKTARENVAKITKQEQEQLLTFTSNEKKIKNFQEFLKNFYKDNFHFYCNDNNNFTVKPSVPHIQKLTYELSAIFTAKYYSFEAENDSAYDIAKQFLTQNSEKRIYEKEQNLKKYNQHIKKLAKSYKHKKESKQNIQSD